MSYPISDIEGIGPAYAERLKSAGIIGTVIACPIARDEMQRRHPGTNRRGGRLAVRRSGALCRARLLRAGERLSIESTWSGECRKRLCKGMSEKNLEARFYDRYAWISPASESR